MHSRNGFSRVMVAARLSTTAHWRSLAAVGVAGRLKGKKGPKNALSCALKIDTAMPIIQPMAVVASPRDGLERSCL